MADASQHAAHGLHLEHLWQNADDSEEVLFLFRMDDLGGARGFIQKVHTQALKENPKANLPVMIFLGREIMLEIRKLCAVFIATSSNC